MIVNKHTIPSHSWFIFHCFTHMGHGGHGKAPTFCLQVSTGPWDERDNFTQTNRKLWKMDKNGTLIIIYRYVVALKKMVFQFAFCIF